MRVVTVAAAQMGPVVQSESRSEVVERMIAMLETSARHGADLVVFPELALTTFFPRWYFEEDAELDAYYEREMPGPETAPLFAKAKQLGVGFSLGYAELTPDGRRFNTAILVGPDGTLLGKIVIDEVVSNLCFGGAKRNRLFICSTTSLRAVYVNARGAG